ncbi:MAG: class I SAM-dependent RNA methyltransferase [Treponema sp.]|jgi:putative N6-adenine-specific DNA methylase|nr:class I SAM-dependent RNA methyltransferase [Treponema sp.]
MTSKEYTALALCAAGAEKVVSNELKKISAEQKKIPAAKKGGDAAREAGVPPVVVESGFGNVRFKTDIAGLYRALFSLRAADRILLEAAAFPAPDFDALFEGAAAVRWEDYIPKNMGVHVGKVRTNRSALRAETSIQAAVHKAAADRLCGRYGMNRLPEAYAAKQAELRVYVEKDRASLLIDLAGEPLFKRGYRREGGTAPLRETTAAAIILLSGWKRKFPLYDPLCGSGTIAIEAAMYAWDMAPGIGRNFALDDLLIGDRRVAGNLREEYAARTDFNRTIRVYGSDADEKAVALAKANAGRAAARCRTGKDPAKAAGRPDSAKCPLFDAAPLAGAKPPPDASGDPGFIITNPPYGRRLGDAGTAEAGYREMAVLAENFPGWKMELICDHPGFESHFGKKADTMREIKSGAVDAFLYEYEKL